MKPTRATAAGVLLGLLAASVARAGPPTETLHVKRFGQISVYAPAAAPSEVVLFVSGDGGWNLGVVPMAETLRDLGALVVGIDIRTFIKALDASSTCAYPAGDLEELSRMVQLRRKLAEYKPPILVGYSSGATLVYAALAAAPPEAFAGAISLGFGPDLEIDRPLCQERGLVATRRMKGPGYDLSPDPALARPWIVLHGELDQVCSPQVARAFVSKIPAARLVSLPKVGHGFGVTRNWERQYVDAYRDISAAAPLEPSIPGAAPVRDLGLAEVPVAPSDRRGDTMAIILTGDGGWADLDKSVAAGLAARGIPSVGWSSLRYYWTPRTPEMAAADLARIIEHYTSAWGVEHVVAVGYSFGADVLPFLVNRLPRDAGAHVTSTVLLGLSSTAAFEFQLSSWFGNGGDTGYATSPEVERLRVPVTCVRGADEAGSGCLGLKGPFVTSVVVGRGHHFDGDYAGLVSAILNSAH